MTTMRPGPQPRTRQSTRTAGVPSGGQRPQGSAGRATRRPLARTVVESPIGPLLLAGTDETLTHVYLPSTGMAAQGGDPGPITQPLADAAAQLEEYFAGRRRSFDLPLDPGGTPFQVTVWRTLEEIPYGETVTYAELAVWVGRPGAFRAVGQANGANPLPIVCPCHRVVAAGGRLGGYGGGLEVKRRLLALEGSEMATAP